MVLGLLCVFVIIYTALLSPFFLGPDHGFILFDCLILAVFIIIFMLSHSFFFFSLPGVILFVCFICSGYLTYNCKAYGYHL